MIHTFTAYTSDDTSYLVRFEHIKASRDTEFEPGHPESIEVTQVNFGKGWDDVSDHPSLDLERLTLAAGWHLERIEEAQQADEAEREHA